MFGINFVPAHFSMSILKHRMRAMIIAGIIIFLSIMALIGKGLNLGIDFKGGVLMEIRTSETKDISHIRTPLQDALDSDVKVQSFGSDHDFLLRLESPGDEKKTLALVSKIKNILGRDVTYRRIETVGPKVSQDLIENGLIAFAFAILGMLIYIWFRFEWQFGVCGVVALMHDIVAVFGFYALSGLEFNETAFAAILTTIGYSINDTVVIYDRLRDNLALFKKEDLFHLMDKSIQETLSRTILTSGTTLLSLWALYVLGGHVIEVFCLPILIGVIVGTLSSIFLSVPLLSFFDLRGYLKKKEEEEQEALTRA